MWILEQFTIDLECMNDYCSKLDFPNELAI